MPKRVVLYNFLIGLFLQLNSLSLLAQEEFMPAPAQSITKFNFIQLTGGIIILKAVLNDYPDSLNFVLDTGSGGISLDSATVIELNLEKKPTNRLIRGIAGIRQVEFTYGHSLHMPGISIRNLDFHINDYELLSSVYGMKIDGIIGYSVLRRYVFKINYDDHTIEILTPGSIRYPRGGYVLKPQFSTLPLPDGEVEDSRSIMQRFIFDTGAGLSLILSREFVEDSSVLLKNKRMYQTMAEGLGGKKNMVLTLIKSFKIGPYKFRQIPTYIFDDEYNVTQYPSLAGIIGNDLLRKFNIIINYPEQNIFLKPNTHFNEPFDYAYSGLGIYLVQGEIKVLEVMQDSPAARAGFKEGDILFAVDRNFSKSIQVYKSMLQIPGQALKVVVFREGRPVELKLLVHDIRKKYRRERKPA
jgi:hypothetical protein